LLLNYEYQELAKIFWKFQKDYKNGFNSGSSPRPMKKPLVFEGMKEDISLLIERGV